MLQFTVRHVARCELGTCPNAERRHSSSVSCVGLATIGVADYAFDCHPVEIVPSSAAAGGASAAAARATVEGCLSDGNATKPVPGGWQIPYTAITPKPTQLRNLLVPVALSASHVAFASIRLELTWMVLGPSKPNCVPLLAARTLNATGQSRVTLSLQ